MNCGVVGEGLGVADESLLVLACVLALACVFPVDPVGEVDEVKAQRPIRR